MVRSIDRFLTTHTGSLPRPDDLARNMYAKEEGQVVDRAKLATRIRDAVAGVVAKQKEAVIDIINDGEMSKPSYATYVKDRLSGSGGRAAALLRLAAVTVGRTDTPLGAFYRRLSSRIGKAKAVTATARKVAVLFYNAMRHGMEYVDPGASSYETRYRMRVVNNLHRRAKAFGFVLQPLEPKADAVVS